MKYKVLAEYYSRLERTTKRLEKTRIISELLKKTDKKLLSNVVLLLQGRVFPVWDDRVLGISSKLVLKVRALASGTDSKKIEEMWK